MKRRKPPPDTRPNWRDPNMPVYRDYQFSNGKKTIVDPDYERRYREMLIATSLSPGYRQDPTYDLKKDKK